MSADDRAEVISLFIKALSQLPRWAVAKGFDAWEKTGHRRPSPGEIVILAERAVKEITDELTLREKELARQAAADAVPPPLSPESRAEAQRILDRVGFTPKRMAAVREAPMASSLAEAERIAEKSRMQHWTEWGSDVDRARMELARDANPLVQAARETQARMAAE